MWTVGEVEAMTGVTRAMLRDYDEKGLLCPMKTGEGISNNRKLYSEDDIERLKRIVVLRAYDFSLKEIKSILDDDETTVVGLLEEKIEELKREENRLRNLILFAKFVDITDTELFEGLASGPTDIDAFADMVRGSELYRGAIERIQGYSEEELEAAFDELVGIIADFVTIGEEEGFAGVEWQIDRFCAWWDEFVAPTSEGGYLGFWAVFEDDSIVVECVESVGGEHASGALQMSAFYVWMKRIACELGPQIAEVAAVAERDVILATDIAEAAIRDIGMRMGALSPAEQEPPEDGGDLAEEACDEAELLVQEGGLPTEVVDLAISVLDYIRGIIADDELRAYLDPEGSIVVDEDDLAGMRTIVSLMVPADAPEGQASEGE